MRRIRTAPAGRTHRRGAGLVGTPAALALALLLAAAPPLQAGEIIPSLGLTKPRHEDNGFQNGGDARLYGGVAFRANLATLLQTEIGVMYRDEKRAANNVTVRMWPVTASLWLSPVPLLYAGGGVGWYNTTIDYSSSLPLRDETHQDFGVHVGGGLRVPFSPDVMLDLSGRYVFLNDIDTKFADLNHLDPDFWTLSLGLAIGF